MMKEQTEKITNGGGQFEVLESSASDQILILKSILTRIVDTDEVIDASIFISEEYRAELSLSYIMDSLVEKGLRPGDAVVYICKNYEDNSFRIMANVKSTTYESVKHIRGIQERMDALRFVCRLPEKARKEIAARMEQADGSGGDFKKISVSFERFSIDNYKTLFKILRPTLTEQQAYEVETILREAQHGRSDLAKDSLRKLESFFNISTVKTKQIRLSRKEILEAFRKELYFKDEGLLNTLTEMIIDLKYNNKPGQPVLLIGPPGVGKTSIARCFAKIIGYPFKQFSLGSYTSKDDYIGCNSVYAASHAGEIQDFLSTVGTNQVEILLDEFESLFVEKSRSNSMSPAVLNDPLGEQRTFKDAWVQITLNMSNVLFFATANSLDPIPEAVRNRFLVIRIPELDENDRVAIAKTYLLPETLGSRTINGELLTISDDVIRYISGSFCADLGVRDLKRHLESIVRRAVSIYDENAAAIPIKVDKAFVDAALGTCVKDDDPIVFYRRNYSAYSKEKRMEIETTIARLKDDTSIDGDLRDKLQTKLECMVFCIPKGDAFTGVDYDQALASMDATHFGMKKAKRTLLRKIFAKSKDDAFGAGAAILLVGPYGTGKSSFGESCAAALHAPLVRINLNGCNDSTILKGHSFTYVGAKPSELVEKCAKVRTSKVVILLDEADKMGGRDGVSAQTALVDLLDGKGAFRDLFSGMDYDFSQALIIVTANEFQNVLPVLRDRLELVEVTPYSNEEKTQIAKEYLVPKALKDIPTAYQIVFTDAAIDEIVARSTDVGAREIERSITTIVQETAVLHRRQKTKKKVTITGEDVTRILGAPPIPRGNYPETAHPGLVKGLCVGGNRGIVFAVDSVVMPGREEILVTGLAEQDVLESAKRCVTFIKKNYPRLLDGKTIHIDYAEGSVKKSGSSAGVATLISILSAASGRLADQSCAMTGEIGLNGAVFAVGGIKAKVLAAIGDGCKKVFIPKQNQNDEGLREIDTSGIEVIPVSHVDEIIRQVLPDADTQEASDSINL